MDGGGNVRVSCTGTGCATGWVKRAEKARFTLAGIKAVAAVWPGFGGARPKSGTTAGFARVPEGCEDCIEESGRPSLSLADPSDSGCDSISCPSDGSAKV